MKSPPLAALFGNEQRNSLNRALDGWRRSADRTRLRQKSLLTGNFTGKTTVSARLCPQGSSKIAASQGFHRIFPSNNSREFWPGNRDALARIRDRCIDLQTSFCLKRIRQP